MFGSNSDQSINWPAAKTLGGLIDMSGMAEMRYIYAKDIINDLIRLFSSRSNNAQTQSNNIPPSHTIVNYNVNIWRDRSFERPASTVIVNRQDTVLGTNDDSIKNVIMNTGGTNIEFRGRIKK